MGSDCGPRVEWAAGRGARVRGVERAVPPRAGGRGAGAGRRCEPSPGRPREPFSGLHQAGHPHERPTIININIEYTSLNSVTRR